MGDSARRTAREAPPQCAVKSTVRWGSPSPWLPVTTDGVIAGVAHLSIGAAARARAWEPKRLRLQPSRLAATDRRRPPTLAPGARPRSGSSLPLAARWPGAAAFLRFWVIHKVSCNIE
jgi:hypothetical protein